MKHAFHAAAALVAAFIALTAVPALAVAGDVAVPDGAICMVYDQQVAVADFDQLMSSTRQQYTDNTRPFPAAGSKEYKALTGQAIGFLVQRALLRRAGSELGVTVTDAEVTAKRNALIRQYFNGSVAAYEQEVKRTGYTEARVRADLRDQALGEKVFQLVTKRVKPPTAFQVQREYHRHPGTYRIARSRSIDHIFVATRAQAVKLRAALVGAGEAAFKQAAKQHSLDTGSAAKGGRMVAYLGQGVPPFDKVVFRLATGDLSAAFHTEDGWHLVYAVGDVRPSRMPKFGEVRHKIRGELFASAQTDVYTMWTTELQRTASPSITCRPENPWVDRPAAA